MQRQFCEKLLSKIAGNASRINTNSISAKSVSASSVLKTNLNPVYQQSLSQHSTLSNGFSWSSIRSRRFFSNTLLKGQSKSPVHDYASRFFHSFDSQYRGWKSGFRRLTTDGVVIGLIVTNVAVYILWQVAGPQFMVKNFMISVDNFSSGRLHTLITSAFSHRDTWHLISNMVGLYFFGTSIGRSFGPEYLLKLYLSGAVVGSIFYLAYHAFIAPSFQSTQMPGIDPSRIPGLGASGAVNAIMLLDIFLFPTKTLYFDFIIPVPAILLGIYIIGNDILRILKGDSEVSGSAHLGGAIVAALAWLQSRRGRFRRF